MDNHDHALSALPAALALAPVLGLHTLIDIAPFALAAAGWATSNDLDCAGASPTHLAGPLGRGISRAVCGYSSWLYRHSRGPRDNPHLAGTHRYATHTPIHVAALAATAVITTALPGPAGAVAALAWLILGFGFALISLHRIAALVLAVTMAAWLIGTPIAGHNPAVVIAAHAGWIGVAVALGALVHLIGDGFTDAGIPLLFPLLVNGKRWGRHGWLPRWARFTTDHAVERWAVRPLLGTATVVMLPGASVVLVWLWVTVFYPVAVAAMNAADWAVTGLF